jgi:hypothetical protein
MKEACMVVSSVHSVRWLRVLAGLAALMAAVMGSAASALPASAQSNAFAGEFVGRVDADTFIGVVSNGHDVIAYVCNGSTIASWHRGVIENGEFRFDVGTGDTFSLQFEREVVRGRRLAAAEDQFRAELGGSGIEGVFRADVGADTGDLVGGWIVLPDGDFRGAVVDSQGAIVGSGDLNLERLTATIGGRTVAVERLTPDALH